MTKRNDDAGQAEVQKRTDAAEERGYLGRVPDPTPNAAYTVEGVLTSTEAAEADRGAATGGQGGEQAGDTGLGNVNPDGSTGDGRPE